MFYPRRLQQEGRYRSSLCRCYCYKQLAWRDIRCKKARSCPTTALLAPSSRNFQTYCLRYNEHLSCLGPASPPTPRRPVPHQRAKQRLLVRQLLQH
ncbi:hypothetical protein J6590_025000 [Homalodisca vitripennis]|nr:hypothetical protein J6590_025000 [Homalodisca vitripennis]